MTPDSLPQAPYPWYGFAEGVDLLQGDILANCPVVVPAPDLDPEELTREGRPARIEVRDHDVVVMSQSCDLANDKLQWVQLCPIFGTEELVAQDPSFRSPKTMEALRRGNLNGFHLLKACELQGFECSNRIVGFRDIYGMPREFVRRFAQRQGRRIRLLPPYREHLAQAFARFFMRVGLPVEVPPFVD